MPTSIKKKFDITNLDQLDHLHGLLKVEISLLTQIFVGCRVGEHIEVEKPWIYVDKEKIVDHVEFYKENSEFFPVISVISEFPKDKILLGTYNLNRNDKIKFYICGTLDVEKTILKGEKRRLKFRRKRPLLSVCTETNKKWISSGSEYYVDCELIKNKRPLIVVELEGYIPKQKTKTRFVLRKVENIQNGYIELVNNRSSFNMILRKRIDTGAQSRPPQRSIAVQATFKYMHHKSVQCFTEFQLAELHRFAFHLTKLSDLLKINIQINLYKNDYKGLQKSLPPIETTIQSIHLKSYQDVINCKRRQISCFSWNAIISGIVAAAHTTTPIFTIERNRPIISPEFDMVYHEHLILIWEYKNNLYPKLYLHASRDVTALSFCPYNVNILVAGYSNGQIAVWDLTDRLGFKEPRAFLTDVEQSNHVMIAKDTGWFKQPLDTNHIFPVLSCTFQDGHRDAVTTIGWIPPSKYISAQRIYEDSEENMPHMQFITASLDGQKILVWDLQTYKKPNSPAKKNERLPNIRIALHGSISPLNALKNIFKPVCQMLLKNLGYPVTGVLVQSHMYCYVAQNPHTLKDINQPTFFKVSENSSAFDYSSKFYLTTTVGTFHEATWEASDLDGEHVAINENCTITKCHDVHDGPILVCEANPCFPSVVLTIGGSILAIWTLKERKIPLFWRKYLVRCITGMWFFLHPLAFLVVRSDRFYDIWNICQRSDAPIKTFKYNGYDLTKLYQDTTRIHVHKNTCVITDIAGAFQLYSVPTQYSDNELNIKDATEFLNRLNKMKQNLEQLKENYRKEQTKKAKLPQITISEPSLEYQPQREVQLQIQQQKHVYFKIEENLPNPDGRKLLARKAAEKIGREIKIRKRLERRKEIFENAKGAILGGGAPSNGVEKSSKTDSKEIKEKYFIQYEKLEQAMMEKIKNGTYIVNYNWTNYVKKRKYLF